MTTPSGWEPRTGPTRGNQARRAPRGAEGWPPDEADPRRQGPRDTGRDWDSGPGSGGGGSGDGRGRGPRFIPDRARTARDGGPAGQRAPRDGQGRRFPGANGYDRRGVRDDFDGRPRSGGEVLTSGRGRPGGPPDGLDGPRLDGPLRWLGTMSARTAALVLIGAAFVGAVLTVIKGTEPGNLLGFFVIVGSLAAVLGVRHRAVYLFFPVPALVFFVAAVVTGIIHDREIASSTLGLGATFPQWVAGIFWPAVVTTILVLFVGTARLLLSSPLIRGQSPRPAGRPLAQDARVSQGSRRPAADSWPDDRFDAPSPRPGTGPTPRQGTGPTPRQGTGPTPRQGTGPTPRQGTGPTPRQQGSGPVRGAPNGSRPGRAARDPRTDRDPWGDPRLPPDRSQPTGPRPQTAGGPASRPQPRAPRPGQTGPGPSFNPAPSPQRRQPPEGWTQR